VHTLGSNPWRGVGLEGLPPLPVHVGTEGDLGEIETPRRGAKGDEGCPPRRHGDAGGGLLFLEGDKGLVSAKVYEEVRGLRDMDGRV
jgi:hypothetical protein